MCNGFFNEYIIHGNWCTGPETCTLQSGLYLLFVLPLSVFVSDTLLMGFTRERDFSLLDCT